MMLRSDGYEDLPDEPGRPRFKRGAFGVLSAFFVVLLIAKTSISAVDYGNGGAVTEDAKVAPGPLARDAASTASGSIRGFRGDADTDDDHTVQKLENQTVLDDDTSLLSLANLTEIEVVSSNGTAEVVEFAETNDDHTVQKLENQTVLDDDTSLLSLASLTEIEVVSSNGTAEVVEFAADAPRPPADR